MSLTKLNTMDDVALFWSFRLMLGMVFMWTQVHGEQRDREHDAERARSFRMLEHGATSRAASMRYAAADGR